jgi:integrase
MPKRRPPRYLRHTARNLGYSRIDGKQVYYPGQWNSAESLAAYEARMAEWRKAADRQRYPLTIADLVVAYTDWADRYYVQHGEPTRYATSIKAQMKLLLRSHRHTLIVEFTPVKFADWLDSLDGTLDRRCKHKRKLISRQYLNKTRSAVLRMFRWGVRKGMVDPSRPRELWAIVGPQLGRTTAPEAPKVEPVSDPDVDATLPHLRPQVRAMVQVQRLTGMRPGEVMVLRPGDITIRPDGVMVFRPHRHKLQHRGIERLVFIGPRAAEVLRPWLNRDPDSYCFQPRETVAGLRTEQRARRKTRVQPSQIDRSKPDAKRKPRNQYDKNSYAQAVRRACIKAGVPVWRPNQLRHTAATMLRATFGGMEAATAVLGHCTPVTTKEYAKIDYELAARAMRQIG